MGPDGPDGLPGNAYFEVTSSDGTLYSYTDNSGLGSISVGDYYLTSAGTYHFAYEARIYSGSSVTSNFWDGQYTIHINPGEKGGSGKIFWQKGDPGSNGPDSYLDLDCDYSGVGFNRSNTTIPKIEAAIGDTTGYIQENGDFSLEVHAKLVAKGVHRSDR